MKLFVDIGNSNIKFAPCHGQFEDIYTVEYDKSSIGDSLKTKLPAIQDPEKIIAVNVAGKDIGRGFTEICQKSWSVKPEFQEVSRSICGVTNGYDDFKQMGADRWMAMIAAWNRVQDSVIVIDFGSALTIDIVNHSGVHLGGYIMPGKAIMKDSLLTYTDIKITENVDVFAIRPGKNTNECVNNGTGRAALSLITDVCTSVVEEGQGLFRCIITGGGAKNYMEYLTFQYDYEPLLVFQGMKIVDEVK